MLDFLKPASFREELSHEAIGVFVRAALSGTIGERKVNPQSGFRGKQLVFGELLAVVQSQRSPQTRRQGANPVRDRLAHSRGMSAGNLAQQEVAGFPIDQCDGAALVCASDHSVALPVAVTILTTVSTMCGSLTFGAGPGRRRSASSTGWRYQLGAGMPKAVNSLVNRTPLFSTTTWLISWRNSSFKAGRPNVFLQPAGDRQFADHLISLSQLPLQLLDLTIAGIGSTLASHHGRFAGGKELTPPAIKRLFRDAVPSGQHGRRFFSS
jgi:hypothetical protein